MLYSFHTKVRTLCSLPQLLNAFSVPLLVPLQVMYRLTSSWRWSWYCQHMVPYCSCCCDHCSPSSTAAAPSLKLVGEITAGNTFNPITSSSSCSSSNNRQPLARGDNRLQQQHCEEEQGDQDCCRGGIAGVELTGTAAQQALRQHQCYSFHWCVKPLKASLKVEQYQIQSCSGRQQQHVEEFAQQQQQKHQQHQQQQQWWCGSQSTVMQTLCSYHCHSQHYQQQQQQKQGSLQPSGVIAAPPAAGRTCNPTAPAGAISPGTGAAGAEAPAAAVGAEAAGAWRSHAVSRTGPTIPPPVRLLRLVQLPPPCNGGIRPCMGLQGGSYKAACIKSEEGSWGLAKAHASGTLMARAMLAWVEATAWGE